MQKLTIRVRSSDLVDSRDSVIWVPADPSGDSQDSDIGYLCGSGIGLSVHERERPILYLSETIPGRVKRIRISGDGKWIACASTNGSMMKILIWDASSHTIKSRFEDQGDVSCVCFSYDSKYLLSLGGPIDRSAIVYELSNERIVVSTEPPLGIRASAVCCGGFERDVKKRPTGKYLFGTCGGDSIAVWAFNPLIPSLVARSVPSRLGRDHTACVFSADGETLYAGTNTGDIISVGVRTACISDQVQIGGSGGIAAMVRYGDSLAVGGRDGSIFLVRISEIGIEPIKKVSVDKSWVVTALSVNIDDQLLVGMSSGSIFQLDLRLPSPTPVEKLHLPTRPVSKLVHVSDTSYVSASNELVQWNQSECKILHRCPEDISITSFAWSRPLALVGRSDSKVVGIDNKTGIAVWDLAVPSPTNVKLVRNMKTAVVSTGDGEVRLYDLRNREMKVRLKEHVRKVSCMELFADETFAISSGRDGCLVTYDMAIGKQISCHKGPRKCGINSFVLCRDQATVQAAGMDRRVTQWDLRVMDPIQFFSSSAEVISMSACDDGKGSQLIITGDAEGVVKLFDGSMREMAVMEHRHFGNVETVAVRRCNGGNINVVSGGADNSIFEYELRPESPRVDGPLTSPKVGKLELSLVA